MVNLGFFFWSAEATTRCFNRPLHDVDFSADIQPRHDEVVADVFIGGSKFVHSALGLRFLMYIRMLIIATCGLVC